MEQNEKQQQRKQGSQKGKRGQSEETGQNQQEAASNGGQAHSEQTAVSAVPKGMVAARYKGKGNVVLFTQTMWNNLPKSKNGWVEEAPVLPEVLRMQNQNNG